MSGLKKPVTFDAISDLKDPMDECNDPMVDFDSDAAWLLELLTVWLDDGLLLTVWLEDGSTISLFALIGRIISEYVVSTQSIIQTGKCYR